MPRTCVACASEHRREIDNALIAHTSLREISEKFPISISALHRHKAHACQAIVKADEKREVKAGDNILDEMKRIQAKGWELLSRTENEKDHRGSIVALREIRECLGTLGEMLEKAKEKESERPDSQWNFGALTNEELDLLEGLYEKASIVKLG
jgi:transposase